MKRILVSLVAIAALLLLHVDHSTRGAMASFAVPRVAPYFLHVGVPLEASTGIDANSTTFSHANGVVNHDHTNITVGGSATALVCGFDFGSAGGSYVSNVAATWDTAGGSPTNQAMSQRVSLDGDASIGNPHVEIFGLRNPTPGNKTLHITWTTSAEIVVWCQSYTGSDTTSDAAAFPHTATAIGTAATASITLTSATGNRTFSTLSTRDDCTAPNQNSLYHDTATSEINACGQDAAGAATVTHSWAISGGQHFAEAGVDIAASGGGAAKTGCGLLLGVMKCD